MTATPSVGGQLEPATQAFIDSLSSAKPIYTLSPEAARAVLAGAQKSVSVTLAPASVEDRVLNVGPKGRTNIRLYRPAAARGALPAVVYTHGGGWILGDKQTHDRSSARSRTAPRRRSCSSTTRARLRPTSRWRSSRRTTANQVGRRTRRRGRSRRVPPRVAGDSVGGNMAAASRCSPRSAAVPRSPSSCSSTR